MAKGRKKNELVAASPELYGSLVTGISDLLDEARRSGARTVNSILTAAYWEIGRRIVVFEQGGKARAEYGEGLLVRLATDLTAKHGRGFSKSNLFLMRGFFSGWEIFQTVSGIFEGRARLPVRTEDANEQICQTPSGKFEAREKILQTLSAISPIPQTLSAESGPALRAAIFPLSWSHYVRLMSVSHGHARAFYESEAIRGGWSVRQLDCQISTQFFERTSHSRQQAAMLARGQKPKPEDAVSAQDEVRDPYLLEFLNLKDEYSETDLEEALIEHLEAFLLELGAGFTFVARQKRIRIGAESLFQKP